MKNTGVCSSCRLTVLGGCAGRQAAALDLLSSQPNSLFELLNLRVAVALFIGLLLLPPHVVLHQLNSGNEWLWNAEVGILLYWSHWDIMRRWHEVEGSTCFPYIKKTKKKRQQPFPGLHSCQSPALTGSWWGSDPLTASWTTHLKRHCTGSHLKTTETFRCSQVHHLFADIGTRTEGLPIVNFFLFFNKLILLHILLLN